MDELLIVQGMNRLQALNILRVKFSEFFRVAIFGTLVIQQVLFSSRALCRVSEEGRGEKKLATKKSHLLAHCGTMDTKVPLCSTSRALTSILLTSLAPRNPHLHWHNQSRKTGELEPQGKRKPSSFKHRPTTTWQSRGSRLVKRGQENFNFLAQPQNSAWVEIIYKYLWEALL